MNSSNCFRRLTLFGWLSIFACGFFGCEKQIEQKEETVPVSVNEVSVNEVSVNEVSVNEVSEEEEVTVTEEAPVRTDEAISLKVHNEQEFDELIAKHAGKVVFVDFWATWCIPCRKSFPHIVELGKKHADDGLVVVTVSFDETDEESKQVVLKFLTEQNSAGENLLSEYGGSEKSYNVFNITGGALPHGKLFDRAGKLVQSFGFSEPDLPYRPETIEGEIRKALEKD